MLSKYHKYKLNKKRIKQLRELAVRFKLPYDARTVHGYLHLTIFEDGLRNKALIEQYYEKVRNQCYDMWDYLSFYERNDLILLELNPELMNCKHFIQGSDCIFIPFFDELMNALYVKEVAILELPQFFHLYKDFINKIIPISHYGLKPFIANMSEFNCTYDSETVIILHDTVGKAFIKILNSEFLVYPYLKSVNFTSHDEVTLSRVLSENDDDFYHALIGKEAVSKRFTKKYHKMINKKQKKVKP